MNKTIVEECTHLWDSDKPVRLCVACGQIRTFPNGDDNPRVLWPGKDTKDDPLQLVSSDKALIAVVAHRFGAKKTGQYSGIPWGTLRPWISVFCREPKTTQPALAEPVVIEPETTRPTASTPKQLKGVTLPMAIILSKFEPGDCLICGGALFRGDDYIPHYIQTPDGKLWLCGVCAEGVAKLFKALGITCQVIGDKDHA